MNDNETPPNRRRRLTQEQINEVVNSPAAQAANASNPLVVRRKKLYADDAAGVLRDLADAGFSVDSVGELRQRRLNYRAAVPILLDWFPRVWYLPLAEDIVRTLSVSFTKRQALPVFLQAFQDPPNVSDPLRPETSESPREHLRWVLGNGIGILASPAVAEDLIALAIERQYGHTRSEIVLNLPKTKDERVPLVLLELIDDPTVAPSAIEALGKMRHEAARERLESELVNSDKNVRDQAKKALRRLDG